MTEDDAKKKWCPMVRHISDTTEPAANRWGNDCSPEISRCIASDCMMWRWDDQQTLADALDWVHASSERRIEDFKPKNPTIGHCGLAK